MLGRKVINDGEKYKWTQIIGIIWYVIIIKEYMIRYNIVEIWELFRFP